MPTSPNKINDDFVPLLRHFSVTDGLVRGTGLVDSVIFTAAFALVPGFGVYGLFLSVAVQDLIAGVLDIPFGWLADRLGWGKATLLSFSLRVGTASLMLFAVLFAWHDARFWAWTCVVLNAVIDAFAACLQNGAYEAAYSEWYRRQIATHPERDTAPPLFIRSLRYAMTVRFLIPASTIFGIILLQQIPGLGESDVYVVTLIGLFISVILNVVTFLRIAKDLLPTISTEKNDLSPVERVNAEAVSQIWKSIREKFAPFALYTLAAFQVGLSGAFIAGLAIKEMNKLALPQPYGWISGVSFILGIHFLDTLFWTTVGYRIQRSNLVGWVRALCLFFLFTNLLAAVALQRQLPPLANSIALGLCVFAGIVCGSAVRKYFASHIRDYLKSSYVATWFSIAGALSSLGRGLFGLAIIGLDRIIPSALLLLSASGLVTLATIKLVSEGALTDRSSG